MVIREVKKLLVDVYRDIEFMNNNSKHGDINSIVKVNNDYIARFGTVSYTLASRNINEILYMLNNINNTLDIIPLIDNEGVKLGLFYRISNDKFIYARQFCINNKIREYATGITMMDLWNNDEFMEEGE